ncbi:unnamed protein product [Prorocentrum cordatum]|uniref:Uncharacterized protein n=1 Tax=Prorocentrum cordatum TaxID=2364126 RepID=A0ABN9WSL8_9DINO|nr:unnamed protein product [Polarella glacialis]
MPSERLALACQLGILVVELCAPSVASLGPQCIPGQPGWALCSASDLRSLVAATAAPWLADVRNGATGRRTGFLLQILPAAIGANASPFEGINEEKATIFHRKRSVAASPRRHRRRLEYPQECACTAGLGGTSPRTTRPLRRRLLEWVWDAVETEAAEGTVELADGRSAQAVAGALNWLSVRTRPDIARAASRMSSLTKHSKETHQLAKKDETDVTFYTDASFARVQDQFAGRWCSAVWAEPHFGSVDVSDIPCASASSGRRLPAHRTPGRARRRCAGRGPPAPAGPRPRRICPGDGAALGAANLTTGADFPAVDADEELLQLGRVREYLDNHTFEANQHLYEEAFEALQRLSELKAQDIFAFRETWTDLDTELLRGLDEGADGFVPGGELTTEAFAARLPSIEDDGKGTSLSEAKRLTPAPILDACLH